MKYLKLPIVADGIFTLIASFFLSYAILSYFFDKLFSLFTSLAVSFVAFFFVLIFKKRRWQTAFDDKKRVKEVKNAMYQLAASERAKNIALIEKSLINRKISCSRKNGGLFLPEKNAYIFPLFSFDGVSKSDIVKCFNKANCADKIIILACEKNKETEDFIRLFGKKIELRAGNEVYSLLEKGQALPEITMDFKDEKPKISDFLRGIFKKKRARGFFATGIFTLLFSFIVPFKLYYIITGSVMLIASLICRFYGKDERADTLA